MKPTEILLCTLNSTYQHSSFGLRYIHANMGELQPRSRILEGTIKENPRQFVEKILTYEPKIVGFGVYIWNASHTLETIMILKKVAPQIKIVLGGPEISYQTAEQTDFLSWSDYVIQGEADLSFRELCEKLLLGTTTPLEKIKAPQLPDIKKIVLPYSLYTDEDIQNRVIYVEASRGCPYKCEYCLSSLDKSVRNFELEQFLAEMKTLLVRGVRSFKFVDRTFNLSPTTSTRILQFFLEHIELGLFLHFELVPDRLPIEIRELIKKFPAGSLQFEIGIQTLNPVVAQNVSRKNDLAKVAENFKFIREETSVHTHADLIVGLPGESFESFAAGFDQLAAMNPDEVQVGILKRLKGTPIVRHDQTYQMIYSDLQPFQILSTAHMNFQTLQKMNRFAKFWDLYANSGEFKNLMLWFKQQESLFASFFAFSEFLSVKFSETHSLSLINLAQQAYSYLLQQGVSESTAHQTIVQDYCYGSKRRDLPPFLKPHRTSAVTAQLQAPLKPPLKSEKVLNPRQLKHLN